MPTDFTLEEPFVRLRLLGSESSFPMLADVENFLYDLNFLYEILRLAADPQYERFRFSHNVFFRRGRPLEDEDRLHVERLTIASPIDIHLVVNLNVGLAAGTVVGTATLISILAYADKIATLLKLPLERRKLKAEIEKLERENAAVDSHTPSEDRLFESVTEKLSVREANHYVDVAGRRLRDSPVKLREVDIEVVTEKVRRRES
jgi:hypothetical protein